MQRQLDEKTLVDGQIGPDDVATLKAMGVTLIVNNRPDGEDAEQPTSDEIEAAAKEHGLDYRHVPIARGLGAWAKLSRRPLPVGSMPISRALSRSWR